MEKLVKGMDVSSLLEVERCGGVFTDKGQRGDALEILHRYGMDMIRLRLWNDPYDETGKSYGGGGCDLPCVMTLARRAKELGIAWMLDFQYSDFWTDPGKQLVPKAWQGMNARQLTSAVYQYTSSVMTVLREANLVPDIVSVGNELSSGLLWPYGLYPKFQNIARFLSAGIRAVRKTTPGVPVMIHLDNGCRNSLFHDWFDQYFAAGGEDFEYIGMSYYPCWHGTMEELAANLNDLALHYQKNLMVTETSSGFTLEDYAEREQLSAADRVGPTANANTVDTERYPMTMEGQSRFMTELAAVLRQVPEGRGKGFVYWEPAWLPVPGTEWAAAPGRAYLHTDKKGGNEWANQALFDYDGNGLPALETIRDL